MTPIPFWAGARGVYGLSIDAMLWSRRSLMMGLLLSLPIAFALLFRGVIVAEMPPEVSGYDLYAFVVMMYWVRNVMPLAALFYATALIADEIEGRTLVYLLSRPVSRASILFGKFGAYLTTTLTLTLPAVVVTFFLLATARGVTGLGARVPDLFRDLGVILLGFVAYGALFALMGVLMRRPLIPGMLFLFVWELVANLPGYMPRFTLTAWLRSLVTHRPPVEGLAELFGQRLPMGLSFFVLTTATLVFLAGAAFVFKHKEYVIDQ